MELAVRKDERGFHLEGDWGDVGVAKGAGSRSRGLVRAYKLLDAAQDRWRKVNSPELVIQVRAGIQFKDGTRVERRTQESRDAA